MSICNYLELLWLGAAGWYRECLASPRPWAPSPYQSLKKEFECLCFYKELGFVQLLFQFRIYTGVPGDIRKITSLLQSKSPGFCFGNQTSFYNNVAKCSKASVLCSMPFIQSILLGH